MWSDKASHNLGDVSHGTLDVDADGDLKVYDLRDASGAAKTVAGKTATEIGDLSGFRAVPGEQLEIDLPVKVEAVGKNMRFDFTLALGADIDEADWEFKAGVYDATNALIGNETTLAALGTTPSVVLADQEPTDSVSGNPDSFHVVVTATLRSTLGDEGTDTDTQLRINDLVALGTLHVGVQQVTI
jgi:alternate signal-mediated exported protein